MTTESMIAEVLALGIICSMGWILFHWIYRDYRVDAYRQELFKIRDDLFDLAAAGKIGFDHPAYRMMRTVFNGAVRFGHELDFYRVLILVVEDRQFIREENYQKISDALRQQVKDLPVDVRRSIDDIYIRLGFCHFKHLLFSSALSWVLVVPVVVFFFLYVSWIVGSQFMSKLLRFDAVNEEARRLGTLSPT